jgi:hypothetical protein
LAVGGLIWLITAAVFGYGGIVAPAQEASPGLETSWLCPGSLPAADRSSWHVTADGVRLASGLGSAFVLAEPNMKAVLFSDPGAARAASVHLCETGVVWVHYDLRNPDRVGRSPVLPPGPGRVDPNTLLLAGLSPSGNRLAVVNPANPQEPQVVVWSADAKEVARLACPHRADRTPIGIGFAGEDRVLLYCEGKATVYQLPSGEIAYTIPGPFVAPPTLSPGRRWLAGLTGQGFEWFATSDGSPAGVLPLPNDWCRADPHGGANLVCHPDGRLAAGLAYLDKGGLLVAAWDLTTGRPVGDAFLIPHTETQGRFSVAAAWCGERRLLLASGELVDLDLHTWVCRYAVSGSIPPSPDGRCWRVAEIPANQAAAVAGKLPGKSGIEDFRKQRRLLAAATLPDAAGDEIVRAARHGFAWHPGVAVRLEVGGPVPPTQREATLKLLADALTKHGCRIDPDAPYCARLYYKAESKPVPGKFIKMQGPKTRVHELTAGVGISCWLEVADDRGRPAMRMNVAAFDRTKEAAQEPLVWRDIRESIGALNVPRLYVRDEAGKRPRLPDRLEVGIDGVLDLPPPVVGSADFDQLFDPPGGKK